MHQKLKELEIERKMLKSKIEQLESDVYRINKEKSDANFQRDKFENENNTLKMKQEEFNKEIQNYKDSNSNLQTQI